MRILKILAPRLGASLCFAISALCAASLQAQPNLSDVADPEHSGPVTTGRLNDARSAPRAESLQDLSIPGTDSRRVQTWLVENKLRDKFNAFDYTDELPPNLGFGEFEQSLEQRFFGTYVFYSKLTDEQRLQVYENYRRDRHISAIRTSTLDLLH